LGEDRGRLVLIIVGKGPDWRREIVSGNSLENLSNGERLAPAQIRGVTEGIPRGKWKCDRYHVTLEQNQRVERIKETRGYIRRAGGRQAVREGYKYAVRTGLLVLAHNPAVKIIRTHKGTLQVYPKRT